MRVKLWESNVFYGSFESSELVRDWHIPTEVIRAITITLNSPGRTTGSYGEWNWILIN